MAGSEAVGRSTAWQRVDRLIRGNDCRVSRPMKIDYRGCSVEVTSTESEAFWAAHVCIEPLTGDGAGLREKGEIDGAINQSDAEIAGVEWGKYRVDLFALSKVKVAASEAIASSGSLKILQTEPAVK